MHLILHHFNNSVCSEKVRMVLNEKSLGWESREVDLFKGEQFRPEYLKLNPKAVVHTLVHGDRVLTESTLIAEYLDEAVRRRALQQYVSILAGRATVAGVDLAGSGPLVQ